MADQYLIEPDVKFIREVSALGGDSVKKCFQCATCSVTCPISPETKPFPRKEMIATAWGLKDRVIKSADIWMCHNCGDCTSRCPRGAKPGETLAALRAYAIQEYAKPKTIGRLVNDPKKLPVLLLIPVIVMLAVGLFLKLFGVNWLNFSPGGGEIVHAHFFSTWLVDIIFIPLAIWVMVIFALGLKDFIGDIHNNALAEGKTDKEKIDPKGFVQSLGRVIPTILRHDKFNECGENKERATPHMMVLFGFIGLFIVTNIFFITLYGFGIHGPYSQLNPVKWLGNLAGVALVIGALIMIKNRMAATDQTSTYQDWSLIGLALGLGLTGLLTEMSRLAGFAGASYFLYFVHLVFVFALFFYLPFSKLAHLVYRTMAMAYMDYAGRK